MLQNAPITPSHGVTWWRIGCFNQLFIALAIHIEGIHRTMPLSLLFDETFHLVLVSPANNK